MTEREAFEFEELKRRLLTAHPVCEVCGKAVATQLAHRIPQTKANIRRYGKRIIHHPLNLACVCGLRCNAKVNIGGRPLQVALLVAEILEAIADTASVVDGSAMRIGRR